MSPRIPKPSDVQSDCLKRLKNPAVRTGEYRRCRRVACHVSATLVIGTFEIACVIEDLSISGCRISVSGVEVTRGEIVFVRIPRKKIEKKARVVWFNDSEIGLALIEREYALV